MPHARDAGRMQQFPEEVGRVCVGVARCPGQQARVHTDEEQDQIGGDGVAQ